MNFVLHFQEGSEQGVSRSGLGLCVSTFGCEVLVSTSKSNTHPGCLFSKHGAAEVRRTIGTSEFVRGASGIFPRMYRLLLRAIRSEGLLEDSGVCMKFTVHNSTLFSKPHLLAASCRTPKHTQTEGSSAFQFGMLHRT